MDKMVPLLHCFYIAFGCSINSWNSRPGLRNSSPAALLSSLWPILNIAKYNIHKFAVTSESLRVLCCPWWNPKIYFDITLTCSRFRKVYETNFRQVYFANHASYTVNGKETGREKLSEILFRCMPNLDGCWSTHGQTKSRTTESRIG